MTATPLSNSKGTTLVSVLIASTILGMSFFGFASMMATANKVENRIAKKFLAENYAAELIETFRSQKGEAILNALSTNPNDPGFGPYPLCAHINLIDRRSASDVVLLNKDPNVALPSNPLDGPGPNRKSNRFYIVQVVNTASPPQVMSNFCNRTPPDYNGIKNTGTQRLQITVGVSWVDGDNPPEKILLTTLIPDWS